MSLLKLPQELLIQIAESIQSTSDIYRLTLVNRQLYNLLEPEIYKHETLEQYGEELLQYAASCDQPGIKKMLYLGADINFRPLFPGRLGRSKTALHAAIDAGDIELVKFLLDNGAQVNSPVQNASYSFCPLHLAIEKSRDHNDTSMMTLLLDYGADPNLHGPYGLTPLIVAIRTKHLLKTKLFKLISRGADVNLRGWRGTTPLHTCIEQQALDAMNFLIENGSELNCVDEKNRSPLMLASEKYFHPEPIITRLIDAGADVNFTSPDGRTAILDAARWHHYESLQILLRHGADLHFVDSNGQNVLFAALDNGYNTGGRDALPQFLDLGLDIEFRNRKQQTPFLFFISHYRSYRLDGTGNRVLHLFFDRGANLNARDIEGGTVIHYAAKLNMPGLINMLVKENIEVNQYDKNGESPIFWALKNTRTTSDMYGTVQRLLELGADDHHVNLHGQTLLCIAAHRWCLQLTALLLEREGDVHHRDNEGRSPLHWFAANEDIPRGKESLEILEMLIAHGADVSAQTYAGATPLSMIRKRHTTRHIRKMLVDAGATE
ncbi:hypothetical protein N7478_007408 [Penicillium angulare]|uniref:uncharacterized protein n=1 Tax=Penicillium angulare TaxID=116970 RepID=UPI00253F752D|nr:uncharacterized protein N7478_007408 [Penicillium angulare]KAJ5272283.1 hypothetical protein N7478_007408 [Penicillium angulare]